MQAHVVSTVFSVFSHSLDIANYCTPFLIVSVFNLITESLRQRRTASRTTVDGAEVDWETAGNKATQGSSDQREDEKVVEKGSNGLST